MAGTATPPDPKLTCVDNVNTTTAATLLQVHRNTLDRWIRAKKVKIWYTPGGHIRVPIAEIERIKTAVKP